MYAAGKPAMFEFSGPPGPSARWQKPQANTSGFRPRATTSGWAGCSPGCQTGEKKRSRSCVSVKLALLPGTCRGAPSSGFGLNPGGITGYAQSGGLSAPCTAPAARTHANARTIFLSSIFIAHPSSIDLGARAPDHRGPLRRLAPHQLEEFLRPAAVGLGVELPVA